MAGTQSFLDNLENLSLVMAVALEHAQANHDEFIRKASGNQIRQFERAISRLRTFADELEREFTNIEYRVGTASRPSSPC